VCRRRYFIFDRFFDATDFGRGNPSPAPTPQTRCFFTQSTLAASCFARSMMPAALWRVFLSTIIVSPAGTYRRRRAAHRHHGTRARSNIMQGSQ
jgi:hypothetical protein